MGNSTSSSKTPHNKTGSKVVSQKLVNAAKLGVLSLTEHQLKKLPAQVLTLSDLKTLDVSRNALTNGDTSIMGIPERMLKLKTVNLSDNNLHAGSLPSLSPLTSLQTLNLSVNKLGRQQQIKKGSKKPMAETVSAAVGHILPPLPPSLKSLALSQNSLPSIPPQILQPHLSNLKELDLSQNGITGVLPPALKVLTSLVQANFESNQITGLDAGIFEGGGWSKVKVLNLENNNITSTTNPQTLPSRLFTNTVLHDLKLKNNPMLKRELMEDFEGFDDFLSRRGEVKSKDLSGGAMANLSLCGLD
mmetsp:Transcript_11649/g.21206  ORF Transcript_11649/g.21206 Transcript_11649/m.21206 type:complete len:303 (+) Transcript_11649:169-1077(+)